MVLLPAQGMEVAAIATVAFTTEDGFGTRSATSTRQNPLNRGHHARLILRA
jgi:hypothetical protein